MPRINQTKPNQTAKYSTASEAKMSAIWQPRPIHFQPWLLCSAVCEKKCWKRAIQGNRGVNHEGLLGKSPLVSYTMCWCTRTFSRKELFFFSLSVHPVTPNTILAHSGSRWRGFFSTSVNRFVFFEACFYIRSLSGKGAKITVQLPLNNKWQSLTIFAQLYDIPHKWIMLFTCSDWFINSEMIALQSAIHLHAEI